jgi:hypothetical protein
MKRKSKKTKMVTIRVTEKEKTWLDKNKFSPTKILNESLKQLGYREKWR